MDKALGLTGRQGWTVGVQEAVSLLSCEGGFATVGDLLGRLLGLSIRPPTVQRLAEQVGQRAEDILKADPETIRRGDRLSPGPVAEPAHDILGVAMDGRQAPERDGWHEVKVATLSPNESRGKRSSGRSTVLRKGYLV